MSDHPAPVAPKTFSSKIGETLIVSVVALPVLGILMGGVYSVPLMKLTRQRDPWLTISLCGALAIS